MNYLSSSAVFCLALLLSPVCASGADSARKVAISEALKNEKVCDIQINDSYMPRDLLMKYMDDGYSLVLNSTTLVDVMNMYSRDINYYASRGGDNSLESLQCALKLNQSEERLVNNYFADVHNQLVKANITNGESLVASIKQGSSKIICRQYNMLSLMFRNKNMADKAAEISGHVKSAYGNIPECVKEDETPLKQ